MERTIMQKETTEGNALIAEFDGDYVMIKTASHPEPYPHRMGEGHDGYKPLDYHKDWNLLMSVVEKIEEGLFYVKIRENRCAINGYRKYSHLTFLTQDLGKSKIQATYESVLQFIHYQNSLNSK